MNGMKRPPERRRHPRLPLHLSVAKLVDFKFDGMDQPAPAVLVDLSAGGLSMICFTPPQVTQDLTFRMSLPGLVSAKLKGKIIRARRKGETYQVGIVFTEFQDKWAHLIGKLAKAHIACENRLQQGDRHFCFRECAFWPLCQKEEKARVFPKSLEVV
ncbi:MAG: hypothetical protein A2992_04040 [Elusimicrobia bacterium RIFCSPLOWO2_01_FULL_59_12]|nr:MAG: hypothetical protein A2992_04040 [Elusimicrobia bacterium RIFCSPLOWO2_01_FULL_59_12]